MYLFLHTPPHLIFFPKYLNYKLRHSHSLPVTAIITAISKHCNPKSVTRATLSKFHLLHHCFYTNSFQSLIYSDFLNWNHLNSSLSTFFETIQNDPVHICHNRNTCTIKVLQNLVQYRRVGNDPLNSIARMGTHGANPKSKESSPKTVPTDFALS
jgi:hypothetical protein